MKITFIVCISILTIMLSGCENRAEQTSGSPEVYNEDWKTYYVSSENGSLGNDGLTEDSPLLDIEQVNDLNLNPGDMVLFERGSVFRGNLIPKSGSEVQRITYADYGEGDLPVIMGSISVFAIADRFEKLDKNIYGIPAGIDVGNIIFNEGEVFGVKKFGLDELNDPLDYYYDRNRGVLYIYADDELSELISGEDSLYYSVEFCATQNIVSLSDKHDLIFENLAIKNGGAHGFGGSNTYRVDINNCRISYIGGGFLHYNDDGEPVRYGNGVELFNSGGDICVEDCEIFEIFDTAVTNQGKQNGGFQYNITYRDNIIYNCGMSAFELWLKGRNTTMTGITFADNTVYDIGFGFSGTQGREDNVGLGYFIINFGSEADISDIVIEDNSFTNVYNYHGYGSLLLNMEIDSTIEEDEIYSSIHDNEVVGADYRAVYTVDGEVYFLE